MQLFGPPQILPQVPVLPSNSAPFPVSVFPHVPYPDEEQQGTRVQAFEDTYRLYVLGIPHLTNVDYGIPSDPVATRQKALQIHQSWLYREPNALEIESLATWLWREWMKLPKYSTYRKNQAKDSRRKRPCKNFSWNDEMEWALFRAIAKYPARGRAQQYGSGYTKRMGRNESIAGYIFTLTGVDLGPDGRKIISSKFQTMVAYCCGDQSYIFFLKMKDDKIKVKKLALRKRSAIASSVLVPPMSGLSMSVPSMSVPSMSVPSMSVPSMSTSSTSPRCSGPHFDVKPCLAPLTPKYNEWTGEEIIPTAEELFGPIEVKDFEMYVSKDGGDRFSEPIHVYTRSVAASQGPDLTSDELAEYQKCSLALTNWPPEHFTRHPEGQHLVVEVSIAVPDNNSFGGCLMDVRFGLRGPRLTGLVRSHMTFFSGFHAIESKMDEIPVATEKDSQGAYYVEKVPFCSKTWATLLSNAGRLLNDAKSLATRPLQPSETPAEREAAVYDKRESVAKSIASLTAEQVIEIEENNGSLSGRIATIHWMFRQAAEGQYGRVVWHNLLPDEKPHDSDGHSMYSGNRDAVSDDLSLRMAGLQRPIPSGLQSPIDFSDHAADSSWVVVPPRESQPTSLSYSQSEPSCDDFEFIGDEVVGSFASAHEFSQLDDRAILAFDFENIPIDPAMRDESQSWPACDPMIAPPAMIDHSGQRGGGGRRYLTPDNMEMDRFGRYSPGYAAPHQQMKHETQVLQIVSDEEAHNATMPYRTKNELRADALGIGFGGNGGNGGMGEGCSSLEVVMTG